MAIADGTCDLFIQVLQTLLNRILPYLQPSIQIRRETFVEKLIPEGLQICIGYTPRARCLSDLFYRVPQARGEYITETTVARGV